MKILAAIVLTVLIPVSVGAYDVVAPSKETGTDLVKTSNFLLQNRYNEFCVNRQRAYDLEIEAANTKDWEKQWGKFATVKKEEAIKDIVYSYSDVKYQCEATKMEIESQPLLIVGKLSPNLSCGADYIKRGGICVTHTENCVYTFGANMTGTRKIGDDSVSACTCNTGYSFDGKMCVVKAEVKGATATNAELIALLQAQVNMLMMQLQELLKQKGLKNY